QEVHWRGNLTSPVLFAEAVGNALASDDGIGLVVEVGPHPALKDPTTNNISDARSVLPPYCGTLGRGEGDVGAFSNAL
ncbi:hypothetical protein B0T10DRAFT_361847, partial [Thelonectria olida]